MTLAFIDILVKERCGNSSTRMSRDRVAVKLVVALCMEQSEQPLVHSEIIMILEKITLLDKRGCRKDSLDNMVGRPFATCQSITNRSVTCGILDVAFLTAFL